MEKLSEILSLDDR